MRDLTRAREDMKGLQLKARQRLGAFLLRHGRVYEGKCRWTQAHSSWLEAQAFESPVQQVAFQEYVDAVAQATARVASLEGRMHGALETWSLAPAVAGLRALRGVDTIVAMTVRAELGDLTRFDSPRQTAHLRRKAAAAVETRTRSGNIVPRQGLLRYQRKQLNYIEL